MAYLRKHAEGWRAEVVRNGRRASKVFASKTEANRWAVKIEAEFLASKSALAAGNHTMREAMERYACDVSPNKKGKRWELLRLAALPKGMAFADTPLLKVGPSDWSTWRDSRLKGVTPGTVQREFNLLKHVVALARKEWHWLDFDPFEGVGMPGENKPRTRRISPPEVRAVVRALGWASKPPGNLSQQVALAWLIGLHTAMRAGEILGLHVQDVDLAKRVAQLRDTKNGDDRAVPLSLAGARLLRWAINGRADGPLFTLTTGTRDALFRRAKVAVGLSDLTFHDSRAEALTRMARKVDVLTLARISGHRDVKILANVYYRESAESIAARL